MILNGHAVGGKWIAIGAHINIMRTQVALAVLNGRFENTQGKANTTRLMIRTYCNHHQLTIARTHVFRRLISGVWGIIIVSALALGMGRKQPGYKQLQIKPPIAIIY